MDVSCAFGRKRKCAVQRDHGLLRRPSLDGSWPRWTRRPQQNPIELESLMTAYWLGVLTGFVGISAAFAILQGNSIAATPAMLIVLLAIGGLDIPLMLVGGRREFAVFRSGVKPRIGFLANILA